MKINLEIKRAKEECEVRLAVEEPKKHFKKQHNALSEHLDSTMFDLFDITHKLLQTMNLLCVGTYKHQTSQDTQVLP